MKSHDYPSKYVTEASFVCLFIKQDSFDGPGRFLFEAPRSDRGLEYRGDRVVRSFAAFVD